MVVYVTVKRMKTVTTRIPKEHEKLLERMQEEKGLSRSEALRRLIKDGLQEWREKKALTLLRNHEVTLRKAAKIAGTTYVKMLDLATKAGIDAGYTVEELERDLERV